MRKSAFFPRDSLSSPNIMLALPWSLLALVATSLAHTIEVPASKKECFFEDLHVNDKVASLRL
jgi:hypothetical protein